MAVSLEEKYNLLQKILKELGKVVVAYSGGVDSTFLLKAAVDTLGTENVLACIGTSASLAKSQYDQARQCAKIIGTEILETEVDEVSDTNYAANKADRCFHCKSHICKILIDIAQEQGFDHVVFGTNYDDLSDFRPGNRFTQVINNSPCEGDLFCSSSQGIIGTDQKAHAHNRNLIPAHSRSP